MDLSEWYALYDSRKHGAYIGAYTGKCLDAAAVLRGEETLPVPMEFEHDMGGRLYDWMATSHLFLILISPRVQQVLQEGGFTGWHTLPAIVHHNKLGLVEGYGCLVVTGRTGTTDRSNSPLEQRPNRYGAERPRMVRVGLSVDFEGWDGSDICIPEGGAYVLINQTAREALIRAKITGVQITRLDQDEMDDSQATHQLWKEMGYE